MNRKEAITWCVATIAATLIIYFVALAIHGAHAARRACTGADVARVQGMLGKRPGDVIINPQWQIELQYLGTSVKGGVCYVALAPLR